MDLAGPAGYEFDLGQAAAYMQLAAVEQGIGSCVTTLHHSEEAQAPLKASGRKPLEDVVRYERYS